MPEPRQRPRRALLGVAALGVATRAAAQGTAARGNTAQGSEGAAPARGYSFRVMREGSQIGTHRVSFTRTDDGLTALTEVAILVKLMGFTVFRYDHRCEESWAGPRLRGLTSRQERNGKLVEMVVRAGAGGLLVRATGGEYRLPAEAVPLSWWDPWRFNRPLFDSASGKPLAVTWTRLAEPDGGTLWRAAGDADGEARYAADGTWLGWKTHGEDGSLVTYVPA